MIGFWQDEFLKDEDCTKLIDLFDKTHPNILEKEVYNQHNKDYNFFKRGEGASYCMEMTKRPDDPKHLPLDIPNKLQEYAKYLKTRKLIGVTLLNGVISLVCTLITIKHQTKQL